MHQSPESTLTRDKADAANVGLVGTDAMEHLNSTEVAAFTEALATLRARAALQRLVVRPLAGDRYLVAATSNAWTCEVLGVDELDRLISRVEGRTR